MGRGASTRFLVLPLLVVVLATPIWAQVGLTELNHRTQLQPLSYKDGVLAFQLSYLNITYYSKADIEGILNNRFNPNDPAAKASTNELQIKGGLLLADADIYFTFDGSQVSEDGSSASCSPAKTDKDGIAKCSPKFVKTQNGFEKLEDRKSCGTFQAEFRGAMKGSDEFRPSVGYMVWCPTKSPALSALGPALFSALGSGANLPFCFPAILIAGLLIATMYYSGRDPFSLFDLTTPRLPKMRPARVSTGATMMGVRSAVARYNEAKRLARKDSEKMLAELVGKAKGTKGEKETARREVRKLFKEVDDYLVSAAKNPKLYSEGEFNKYQQKLANIYVDLGLSRFGKGELAENRRKLYSKYMEFSGELLNLYTSSDLASRTMAAARAPPSKGWFYKKVTDWQGKAGTALDKAEAKLKSAKGFSQFIRFAPGVGVAALPKKIVDTIAQRRSAKRWTKYIRRMAAGQMLYMLGTKEKDGERTVRPWLQKLGAFTEKTPVAKYYKWDFQGFQERHNVYRKMIAALDNPAEKCRMLSRDMLEHALLIMAPELLEVEGSPANAVMEKLSKKLSAEEKKILAKIREDIGKAETLEELSKHYSELKSLAKKHDVDAKKLEEYTLLLDAFRNNQDKSVSERLEALIRAKDESLLKKSGVMGALGELASAEKAMTSYGIERVEDSHYAGKEKHYIYVCKQGTKEFMENALLHMEKESRTDEKGKFNRTDGALSQFRKAMLDLKEAIGGKEAASFGLDPAGHIVARQFREINDILYKLGAPKDLQELAKVSNMNEFETRYSKSSDAKFQSEAHKGTLAALTKAIEEAGEEKRKELCRQLSPKRLILEEELAWLEDKDKTTIRRAYDKLREGKDVGQELHDLEAARREKDIGSKRKNMLETWMQNIRIDKGSLQVMVLELEAVVGNRKTALGKINNLDATRLKELADTLGVDPHLSENRLKNKILELLSAIDLDSKRKKVAHMLDMPEEKISESSVAQFVFVKVLEKTQNELGKWGTNMLRASKLVSEGVSGWNSSDTMQDLRTKFLEGVNLGQRVEYPAMRRLNVFSHYHGESAQHIETLLYMTRAYNRAAEFAIASAFKKSALGPVAGSLLGSLDPIMDHTMHSYRMQKAFYYNLIGKDEHGAEIKGKLYDDKFANQLGISKKAVVNFDADAYEALQKRGFLFRDAKYAPYVASSANVGVMPLLEYDENVLKAQGNKSIIMGKKENDRDYGQLLSRVNISDFSSEVKGIVALYERGDGKLLRIDPRRVPEVESLYDSAKVELHRRNELMRLIAGISAGGSFDPQNRLLQFRQDSDYIESLGPFKKGYYRAMTRVGEFTYGVFYENLHQLRDWYAAQARARHALYTVTQSAEKWTTAEGRLNASGYLDNNGLILKGELDPDKADAMAKLVKELENKDIWAAWRKKNFRLLEASGDFSKEEKFGAAEWQSKMYEAKLEKEALKKMKDAGQLDLRTYRSLASEIDRQYGMAKEHYNESYKESRAFTRAAIDIVGSHPEGRTYYGSARNIFTLSGLIPEFKYEQGLFIGMSFTVESSAMRDSVINRGGQRGGESWIKMNMDTGQGIYENPRWWAVSIYEQQPSVPLAFSHFVHRQLLPNAASFYRAQVGLSSFLQRTELDSDWGRAKFKPHTLFGLEKGTSDIFGSTAQEILDFTGASTALYALRKGGKVGLGEGGEVETARSWFVKPLERFGVESGHVTSDTQIFVQNRIQDRVLESQEWKGSSLPKKVQEWAIEYKLLQYDKEENREEHEKNLKRLEEEINPFALKYVDDRPRGNRKSAGVGNYFMKDGSRDRFMELFIVDHINTWRPIIPGMTESAPFMGGTFLSPQVTAYFDEMAAFRPNANRFTLMKDFKYYKYDEATGGIKEYNAFDTHHETYRDVYKFDVPALMHVIKTQSYIKQYEGITPILASVMSVPYMMGGGILSGMYLRATSRPLKEGQTKFVNQELEQITGLPKEYAQSMLWKNSMLRYYDWDEIRYGQNVKPPPEGAQVQPPQQPGQPPQEQAAEPEPNAKMAGLVADEGQDTVEGYQRSQVKTQEELDLLRYMITGNKRTPVTWFRNIWLEHSLQNQFERKQAERNIYVLRKQISLQNL